MRKKHIRSTARSLYFKMFMPTKKYQTIYNFFRYGFHLGFCPICEKNTIYYKVGTWLRDDLRCIRCNSVPRFRAFVFVLNTHFPKWRTLTIHESSPGGASSAKIKNECANYTATHFFPDTAPGRQKNGYRCENLEKQTFMDGSFDLVITQDVFEHILNPARAFSEIERTLKPGGCHVFTVPWYYWKQTLVRATQEDGRINHLLSPVYHGNPIDSAGSLVVTEWGDDFVDFIYKNSGMTTTVIDISDKNMGIEGKFREVFISRKPAHAGSMQ